jgi:hypothetical protein
MEYGIGYNPFFGSALSNFLDPVIEAQRKRMEGERKKTEERNRLAGEEAKVKTSAKQNPFGELQAISATEGDMVNPYAVAGDGMQMTPEMLKFAPFLMGGGMVG